jgi:hypothetical protein
MHRCSDSIGLIAAALAKAQTELVNPERSQIAVVSAGAVNGERSFRYAPLSTGLEIVRKSLSRHEIATVQASEIDQHGGLVRLTTLLAHASGEWISSDWPVCSVHEIGRPHQLGAALTYARRYSLFTLVGIAGEDDNDAPDLSAETDTLQPSGSVRQPNGAPAKRRGVVLSKGRENHPSGLKHVVSPEASAALRDQLRATLNELSSADDLTAWAADTFAQKHTLATQDAAALEHAFSAKAELLSRSDSSAEPGVQDGLTASRNGEGRSATPEEGAEVAFAIPKTTRRRDKKHLKFVSTQPCLVCGRAPSDPHHLRFSQPRALGRKVSDEFTVPLCRGHHRGLHAAGNEPAWWNDLGIDPMPIAQRLWAETR